MVELNVTCIIQGIHFLLVWWLLDRFFFPLVVNHIQKKQAVVDAVKASIVREQHNIAQEQEKQKTEWNTYRKRFKKLAPLVNTVPAFSYSSVLCDFSEPFGKEQKEALVSDMKTIIFKKVLEHE